MKTALFLFAAVILFFSSCRTVTKTQDSHVVKTDTVKEETKDSAGKKEETTITKTKTEEQNSTVVEGEFEVDTTGSGITAKDYEEIVDQELPIISIDNEGTVTIKGKIKKFKVTGDAKKTITDSTSHHVKDTSSVSTSIKTETKQSDQQKHSTTKRKSVFEMIFLPVLFASILVFLFLYWKRKKGKETSV